MMKTLQLLILTILTSIMLISCGDDETETQVTIEQYIADNSLSTQVTSSGLHYIINQEGDGNHPMLSDSVTVAYHGTFLNGDVFDSTKGSNPSRFGLTGVIVGWQEGIPLFSRGGSGILIIPPSLGYGSQVNGSIPANSPLYFEVELIDF